ncbi:MAG: bifunctional aspartate kinase/homoserine dehydrogenase I [Rhodanobacter sp.]
MKSIARPLSAAAAVAAAATSCRVHKFGGSCVADATCFRRVAAIIRTAEGSLRVAVVSAMHGTTDALVELTTTAASGGDWRTGWEALRQRHLTTATELTGVAESACHARLRTSFDDLAARLQALAVLGLASTEAVEPVHGMGELWSAGLLRDLLAQSGEADLLDARDVLVVQRGELGMTVHWDTSAERLAAWRTGHHAPMIVITGFIASDRNGRATTLGRNGSDYSAAIMARLFAAAELTLWGDTDGVLSADPRLVPDAVSLPALSYSEACEMAYFGARVIHPQTLAPVIAAGTPLRIRSVLAPEAPGTRITAQSDATPVKGVSAVTGLALITIEGAGMIGVPGTAERAFGALRTAGVSVVMISQGSSEHSICCVVRVGEVQHAREALQHAFALELADASIHAIASDIGVGVLAVVGDGMAGSPGAAARLFGALARAGVNVRAIAQGASERNISVAVAERDVPRAIRAVHAAFWLSPQTLSIGFIGPGRVGRALLEQIADARERLCRDVQLDLRVRALAGSRRMWLGHAGAMPLELDESAAACDLDALTAHVHAEHLPHAVIIDCSASDAVAERYPAWLAAGIHVVTPNKQAGAGDLERWRAIRAACAHSGSRFRYEATVGAGLPVIQTLRELLDTGDTLVAIDGVLSGTLAWLFNSYDGSVPFSALVRRAHELGYTEPDPREDLSGMDVARKLVIMAREAGMLLSLADVVVESLVPAALADVPREQVLDGLHVIDAAMAERLHQARAQGQVLRHVAHLGADGSARVGVAALPADHAFAHLRLTDNCVQFTTRRYRDNPLVVQGPGAGPEVTAAGVFADLLRIGSYLGARL